MLVLEIGPGNDPKAEKIWPDAKVETVEADEKFSTTYHFDARQPPEEFYGKYDVVIASHVFEHIPYFQGFQVLVNWGRLLRPGGELHILIPSAEWAAIEILSEHPSKVVQAHLHGAHSSEWDVHHAAYTMRMMRALFQMAGMAVVAAETSIYHIDYKGELYPAEQHYVKGIKLPEVEDGRTETDIPEENTL